MTRESELLIDMWDILHRECNKVVTEENYDVIKKAIKALEQEPRKGHWDSIRGYIMDIAWHCSECGEFTCKKHNYCPNCGAKMESEEL